MTEEAKYDIIGKWSEVKLEILKAYVSQYTTIMANQKDPSFKYVYIDAFAGTGTHISKEKGVSVPGSPRIALDLKNPFSEYYFIDIDNMKIAELEKISEEELKMKEISVLQGDCNKILLDILPKIQYSDYRRALCILDPYRLNLNWEIMYKAGQLKTVEIFLNFPIMDINRNILRKDPGKVNQSQIDKMNAFWGDESWREIAYVNDPQQDLFDDDIVKKVSNEVIVKAFSKRLRDAAGFKYVRSMPMKNSTNAVVYYLFFAAHNPAARKIVEYIFDKHSRL